jgi:acetyl esterase/lipase
MDGMWDRQTSLQDFRSFWLKPSNPLEGYTAEGEDVVTEFRKIPMRDGAEVGIKIYRAKVRTDGGSGSSFPSAFVLRFHGGGFVIGGHGTVNPESLLIAGKTNSIVVSVDYKL